MCEILNFVIDASQARTIVRRLLEYVPSGSFLVISHPTTEVNGQAMRAAVRLWNEHGRPPMTLRTCDQLALFFDGLDLAEPGVVSCSRWRPDFSDVGDTDVPHYGGLACKPASRATHDEMING